MRVSGHAKIETESVDHYQNMGIGSMRPAQGGTWEKNVQLQDGVDFFCCVFIFMMRMTSTHKDKPPKHVHHSTVYYDSNSKEDLNIQQ